MTYRERKNLEEVRRIAGVIANKGGAVRVLVSVYGGVPGFTEGLVRVLWMYLKDIQHGAGRIKRLVK